MEQQDNVIRGPFPGPQSDFITRNSDGTITVELRYPITRVKRKTDQVDRPPIESLTFKRITGHHLEAIQGTKGDYTKSFRFFEVLTGEPERDLKGMDGVDINTCGEVVAELMGKSPE